MMTKHIDKAMVSRATSSTMPATGGTMKGHGDGDGQNGNRWHNNGKG